MIFRLRRLIEINGSISSHSQCDVFFHDIETCLVFKKRRNDSLHDSLLLGSKLSVLKHCPPHLETSSRRRLWGRIALCHRDHFRALASLAGAGLGWLVGGWLGLLLFMLWLGLVGVLFVISLGLLGSCCWFPAALKEV